MTDAEETVRRLCSEYLSAQPALNILMADALVSLAQQFGDVKGELNERNTIVLTVPGAPSWAVEHTDARGVFRAVCAQFASWCTRHGLPGSYSPYGDHVDIESKDSAGLPVRLIDFMNTRESQWFHIFRRPQAR